MGHGWIETGRLPTLMHAWLGTKITSMAFNLQQYWQQLELEGVYTELGKTCAGSTWRPLAPSHAMRGGPKRPGCWGAVHGRGGPEGHQIIQ